MMIMRISMMMMTSTVTNINNTWDHSSWILPLTGNGGDDEYDDGENIRGDVNDR